MPRSQYNLSRVDLSSQELSDLRGRQAPGVAYFVDGILRSIGDQPISAGIASVARPTIAGFGDSFLAYGWYNWYVPWGRNESTTLPGIGFVGMERKVSNSAHTLSFDAATRTCTFDGGPATPLVNGFQIIPGASSKTGCGIFVRLATLGTNGTLTCTRAGSNANETVFGNSALWWLGVFSRQGYLIRNYAHSGARLADVPSVVDRAADFDGFILNAHTNDIDDGVPLSTMQARLIAALDGLYAKSLAKVGIVNGCCTYRAGWSAAKAEVADAYNRWLPGALRAYPGVTAQFPWARMVNDAGTGANAALMNSDLIHPDDSMQQLAGKDWADFFAKVLPGTPWDFGSGLGVHSASNPSGNRLKNPNPAGNVSGRPIDWGALSVGSQSATASKVARTDGVAGEWARITGTSIADGHQNFFTLPEALFTSVPADGEEIQFFVEVQASGSQMVPLVFLTELKGGQVVAYSRVMQVATKALPLAEWSGVIALPPYLRSDAAGAPSSIDVRLGQRLLNGSTNVPLDFGRMWVGTPPEFTIA